MSKIEWKEKKYSFMQNKQCEYFPCHSGVPEDDFNCLFCFCPLYTLGPHCGGDFLYDDYDIKDCSNCTLPHQKNSYGYVIDQFKRLAELAKKGVT